jgi:hypothetical protein
MDYKQLASASLQLARVEQENQDLQQHVLAPPIIINRAGERIQFNPFTGNRNVESSPQQKPAERQTSMSP